MTGIPARALLALALASSAITPIARAADLVAGCASGRILRASTTDGVFQFAGRVPGAIQASGLDAQTLMLGTPDGHVFALHVDDGGTSYYFTLPGSDNTAIVPHNDTLLISSLDGAIRRVDHLTGELFATYTSPEDIQAMLRDDQFLYAIGHNGHMYRMPLDGGEFTHLGCLCCVGPQVCAAINGAEIVIADNLGDVLRFSRSSGEILGAFTVPGGSVAMAADPSGALFIADSAGIVRRVDPQTGHVLAAYSVGETIGSLALVPSAACPADVNHDGTVNSADFFAFLDAFFTSSIGTGSIADFNADGRVTSQDFFEFLTAFFTPCA